jgi:hypothetical protein
MNDLSQSMRISSKSDHNEKLNTMKGMILQNLEKMKKVGGKTKQDYRQKQDKRTQEIVDRYEEAKQIADKTFEIVEGQLTKLENYVAEKKQYHIDYNRQLAETTDTINIRFEQEVIQSCVPYLIIKLL